MDVTNQSTRWGVWAPEQLNLNRSWADDRGINSLQILSYLLSAFRITGKEKYLTAWKVGRMDACLWAHHCGWEGSTFIKENVHFAL